MDRIAFLRNAGENENRCFVVGELNLGIVLYGLPKDLVMERELLATGTAITLGSSSAIFAHNLSMLGTKVGFMSKIGKDPLGQIALDRLSASGVEVTQVKRTVNATSTGLSVILPNRTPRYILTYPAVLYSLRHLSVRIYASFSE